VLTPTTTPAQNICEATGHTFAWLVNPFTPRQFLQEYWEQTPLLIPRKQPGYYTDLLSFRDLDSLLASGHRRLPGLRLIKAGTDIAIHRYSPEYAQVGENLYGVVNIDRVFAEHQGGATIILESVHRTSGTVSRFCREMEDALSHPVQANLYLTPKAAQGFEAHYDTHDVFILQVAGCKKWRIFPPRVRLPLRSQAYAGDHDALAPPLTDRRRAHNAWNEQRAQDVRNLGQARRPLGAGGGRCRLRRRHLERGLFVPARTPAEAIALLNAEKRAVLADGELGCRFLDFGLEPRPSTPAELGELMASEVARWGRVIAAAGIEKQ